MFDNDLLQFLFKDWFLANLKESQAIDESRSTESQRKMCKHMCSIIKDAVVRIDHNNDRTCPFLFENFNFEIFQALILKVRSQQTF